MARSNHLHAVPDEFQFETDAVDNDPYMKTITREDHKFIHGQDDQKQGLKQHAFNTRSKNDHDHSEPVGFRCLPSLADRMRDIAKHEATPFKSVSAAWRDAGHWYAVFMERMLEDEDFSEEMKMAMRQAEIEHAESVTWQRVHLVESQTNVIRKMIDVQDWTRLPAMIVAGHEVVRESTVDTSELRKALSDAEIALERR